MSQRPLAIYYEHPDWFRPLFRELDARNIPYVELEAGEHAYNPQHRPRYAALFNRMSPSAWKRGKSNAIFYTHSYLAHLEEEGVPVINGARSWLLETNKALQAKLLNRLNVRTPLSRVVNHPLQLPAAAEGLVFPVLVKPNVGGSGAGIRKFDTYLGLIDGVYAGDIDPGVDGTLLVQEYHWPSRVPTAAGEVRPSIVRVETIGGKFLYAVRIFLDDESRFDHTSAFVEAYTPPPRVIEASERIARAAHLDAGSIDYLESERDGEIYFYDINALSTFVADPISVVGFSPIARLVSFLSERLKLDRKVA